uniref:Uncharacterized protein n=1 Tax=Mucochytrium quahogii TaxID=96639 RepID=A0A7S2RHW0_9STRA|mmetsp:Transcript_15450/g.33300  ORF Transcript_15450/g.33300 Transcript_15450/m.33300 type:complete len:815 (+) Transcript_15450:150-2594(+)
MEQETGTVDENIRLFVPGLEHQAGCFRISDDDLAHDSQGKDNEDAGNRDCMIQNAENENVGAGAHLSCAKSGDESVEINVLDAPKGDLQFSGGSAEFFLKKRNTEDEGQDTEEDEDGRPRTWSNDSGPIRRTLRTIDKYVSPGVDTMIDRASSVLETSTTFFVGRGDEGNDSENSGGDEDASMVDKLRAENAELRANTTVVTNERDEMKKLNHALKLTLDDLTKAHEENRSRLAKLDDLERRIRVVENENEHLGSINDKLQQSMREMHDEAVVLEAEASKVTQMNRDEEELKQKIEELEKQNTDARVFAETSQQQNSALQEEINRVKQANKATTWDFESKIKDLESQVFEMSSENRRLTEDKDELESKLKIQTEKGSTQAELTQKLLKSEQQNVATLEQKLENALSQLSLLESSSNDVQVQLRTEISKLESQNSDYEAQISRMRETFGAEDAEKSKTVEQLRGEIVGLQEQNQLLELSKLKSDRNAKNIEANVLALDTKLTQSTAVQDELSGTVRHLQDQIEQHRKEQLDWEQTERDLEKKVSRLQEQIFRQTDDNSKEFGREQSLVDENASLTHETSELKLSVNTLEQRCSGQQLEISQLNAALLEMRSQRDAARDERKDLVELSSQIDSLKHESEQNRILKETNKDLSEQLITMTKLHQESVRAGGAYTEQLEEVQADYVRDTERLIETVRKHEGTISNLNSDIAKLKVHVEEIELRERKTLKSEQASQEQCDILRQQLESVQRELDETISGLKHEATLLEGVTKAEETLHARILQLESDLKAQKNYHRYIARRSPFKGRSNIFSEEKECSC